MEGKGTFVSSQLVRRETMIVKLSHLAHLLLALLMVLSKSEGEHRAEAETEDFVAAEAPHTAFWRSTNDINGRGLKWFYTTLQASKLSIGAASASGFGIVILAGLAVLAMLI